MKQLWGKAGLKADAPSDPSVSRYPSAFSSQLLLQIRPCLPFGLQVLLQFRRGLQPSGPDTPFRPLGAGGYYPDPDQVVKEILGS